MEHSHSCQYWQKPEYGPTKEQYNQFLQDTQWAHFVTRCNPPWIGVDQCLTCLKFTYYKPNTPRNDMLITAIVEWEGELWYVVSIPTDDFALMEDLADGSGLQIIAGSPARSIDSKTSKFPYASPRMYTLWPLPILDEYLQDSYQRSRLFEQERMTVGVITGEFKAHVLAS